MTAAVVLFVLPAGDLRKGEFCLDWKTARRIPWGVLVLFGGGLSLAVAMEQSGLAAWIGGAVAALGSVPTWVVVAAVATLIVFLTELTSNVATTSMAMPVMAGAAVGLGIEPMLLMTTAALAASMAFMLPVATPAQRHRVQFGVSHHSTDGPRGLPAEPGGHRDHHRALRAADPLLPALTPDPPTREPSPTPAPRRPPRPGRLGALRRLPPAAPRAGLRVARRRHPRPRLARHQLAPGRSRGRRHTHARGRDPGRGHLPGQGHGAEVRLLRPPHRRWEVRHRLRSERSPAGRRPAALVRRRPPLPPVALRHRRRRERGRAEGRRAPVCRTGHHPSPGGDRPRPSRAARRRRRAGVPLPQRRAVPARGG